MEVAREEVVPDLVSVVLLGRIAVEELFDSMRRMTNICRQCEIVSAVIAEPTNLVITTYVNSYPDTGATLRPCVDKTADIILPRSLCVCDALCCCVLRNSRMFKFTREKNVQR